MVHLNSIYKVHLIREKNSIKENGGSKVRRRKKKSADYIAQNTEKTLNADHLATRYPPPADLFGSN